MWKPVWCLKRSSFVSKNFIRTWKKKIVTMLLVTKFERFENLSVAKTENKYLWTNQIVYRKILK